MKQMQGKLRLGIVDWGIGGIGLYKLIKSQLGPIGITYLSDTGVTPYGRMSGPALVSRLNFVFGFMRSQGVTHLVLGCNAASTALPFLDTADLRVESVIESAVRYTARLRPRKLALIGGRRTVLSGVYRRAFADRGIKVIQRIAQPLSALIESGDVTSPELYAQCKRIVDPLKNCSHLLLACTHYPAISSVLKQFVSDETVLLDPATELVNRIGKWRLDDGDTDIFLTTGDPEKMKDAARAAFGVRIRKVEEIPV